MGRINLYVADALEERMASFREQLNWSRIAQDAFEHAIAIEELKGAGKMQEAGIERLRKSRESRGLEERARGHAAGKEWALEVAEFDELERVVSFTVEGEPYGPHTWASLLAQEAIGDSDDERAIESMIESMFGDLTDPSEEFVRGFVEGATEVYAEI